MTKNKRRRRGEELLHAIYQATFEELGEAGYAGLTLGGVAARAGTSKSTLYRRWNSVHELVIDAVRNGLPSGSDLALSGNLREDLHHAMRRLADALGGPIGPTMRALVSEMHRDPQLAEALRVHVFEPRGLEVRRIITEGQARGEVRTDPLPSDLTGLGHELVMFRFLTDGHVSAATVAEILDGVVMPLLRPETKYERQVAELKSALADAHVRLRRGTHPTAQG